MKRHVAFAVWAAASLAAGPLLAESVAAPAIDPDNVVWSEDGSIAAPLIGTPGDAANGAIIYADKGQGNCVACHMVSSSDADFQGTIGPSLDGAGDRWSAEQLRGIVADAKRTFPELMMPSQYKTHGYIRPGEGFTAKPAQEPLPPLMTAQQIEDVVAFLVTLKE